jgi:hypothetical protein
MAKGGSFEREIATLLSLWWSDGERSDIFYRSHASGGRFTMRRKSGKDTANQGGDITCSDSVGEPLIKEWSIEIKTGYGKKTDSGISRWDVLDFLDSRQKEPVLQKMFDQSRRDAVLTDRIPILIFRRNGRTPCIMFYKSYYEELVGYFGHYEGDCITYRIHNLFHIIMPFQNFMEWIPDLRSALCSKPLQSKISNPTRKVILRSPKA